MTLSYWNSQFQFSRILPDFGSCLEGMDRRSAAVDLTFERIAYGPDPRQFVELSGAPRAGGVLPVFIHGGYWRAFTAESHRFVLPALAVETGAVANLEYQLLPGVTLAEVVADAVAGLRCLADRTGCALLAVGHSAGGHLAVMGALRLPRVVSGAVAISGIFDLAPLQWCFLREEVGLTAVAIAGLSPQDLFRGRDARHIAVAVGAEETSEFHRQARLFADTHGAEIIVVTDAHHMTVLDRLEDPEGPLARRLHA